MDIPKYFQLGGQTFEVRLTPTLINDDDSVGIARYRINKILLQESSQGTPLNADQIEQTFCHELVHFILDTMGEKDLRGNEKFVDLFGTFLHQALKTARGSLRKTSRRVLGKQNPTKH